MLSSGESVDEILQLFGNYHQLSEILKEKSNSAGKFFFTPEPRKSLFSPFLCSHVWDIYICACGNEIKRVRIDKLVNNIL